MTRESRPGRAQRRLLVAATVMAVMSAVPLVPARADTVTPPPVDIPPTETDFTQTIAIEQFDPTLGSLQSITLTLTASVTGSMGVENTSVVSGSSGDMELSAALAVASPSDPATTLVVASPASTEVFSLAPFDGDVDFAGTSGVTFADVDAVETATEVLTEPGLLAAATGTGSFDLVVGAVGTSGANATGGNIATFFASQAGATITLTYDYEPIPPEIEVQKATNGVDADDPLVGDVPRLAPGDPVMWTYTVTNLGSVPVADVVVNDDQVGVVAGPASGDVNGDGLLDSGEVWVYEAGGIAEDLADTSATTVDGCPDIDGVLYPTYRNTVTVSATAGGTTITAGDLSHYCNPRTGITVEKATNGVDADDSLGADVPRIAPGDPVTWTYVVSNVGDVGVSDVVVVDDQLGVVAGPLSGDADGDGVLDVDEVWVYEASGVAEDLAAATATTVDGCPDPDGVLQPAYRNTATVTGLVAGAAITAQDVSHYCNGLDAVPVVIIDDDEGDLGPLERGDGYIYRLEARNLGSSAMTGLALDISVPPEVEVVGIARENCVTGPSTSSGSTVRCEGIDLGPNAAFRAEVTVVVATDFNCVVLARAVLSDAGVALSEDGEPTVLDRLCGSCCSGVWSGSAGSRDCPVDGCCCRFRRCRRARRDRRQLGPIGVFAFAGLALGSGGRRGEPGQTTPPLTGGAPPWRLTGSSSS